MGQHLLCIIHVRRSLRQDKALHAVYNALDGAGNIICIGHLGIIYIDDVIKIIAHRLAAFHAYQHSH
ncbi:MAG: hypothetical protein A4E62_00334 [Syntrophorhabdus sp. PtaU1.Bin002]|nr:MAG: hypothetical protein A4E62_00334 [Syntrophorhabdus sp. PtaU1.Bin002]